ncbi:MAG TPA: SDR family oxidoreductase [Pseudonocardia sp.]|jgi:gluconate 5-dehydrogenase|nr:SDR family oxidoreductase [Pseudonocardia sp.]
MSSTLDGEVAVVTGAAGGIGEEISRALREAGARVALVDLDQRALDRVADRLDDGPRVATFALDLTDDAQVESLPERIAGELGPVGVLVNNAGVRKLGLLLETEPEDWRRTIDVDLTAPFVLSRAVLPAMIERGRGKIVNIASMAGLAAFRDRGAYSAAKAGLIMFTKVVAVEYGPHGIWCNAVAPGVVETPMTSAYFTPEGPTMDSIRASTPLGRWARPAEIAKPVVFLCGPDSDFINGTVVTADGGWTAGYAAARLSP